nr:hypothetical protein [bacterium]
DRVIPPEELIGGANSFEEIILAVRVIGNIKSYSREIGTKDAEYWIEMLKHVHSQVVGRSPETSPAVVTRRHGLRKRMCQILGLNASGAEEPVDESSYSLSFSVSSHYLRQSKVFSGEAGEKYRRIFALAEAKPPKSQTEVICFLREVFEVLGVDYVIPDEPAEQQLRVALMDAVLLAHPDRHEASLKDAAEPEYNRLTALLLGLRAKI